jgi:hypothetical protein
MLFKYALTVCDRFSNQSPKRYCGDDRLQLCKKSVISIIDSITYAADKMENTNHYMRFVEDRATEQYIEFLNKVVEKYSKGRVKVDLVSTNKSGVMGSLKSGYDWLLDENDKTKLIYSMQDDYLFIDSGIYEMICMWFQLYNDTGAETLISSYNDPWLWLEPYRYKSTPRVFMPGLKRYWIQYYDVSCSFLTSHGLMLRNRDLLNRFYSMAPNYGRLEADSLNHLLTRRGILGMVPVESVGLHVQTELEKDPFIDWKKIWDSVEENI